MKILKSKVPLPITHDTISYSKVLMPHGLHKAQLKVLRHLSYQNLTEVPLPITYEDLLAGFFVREDRVVRRLCLGLMTKYIEVRLRFYYSK